MGFGPCAPPQHTKLAARGSGFGFGGIRFVLSLTPNELEFSKNLQPKPNPPESKLYPEPTSPHPSSARDSRPLLQDPTLQSAQAFFAVVVAPFMHRLYNMCGFRCCGAGFGFAWFLILIAQFRRNHGTLTRGSLGTWVRQCPGQGLGRSAERSWPKPDW